MVQKEKQVKSYTRKSKSGKQVQVKSYSAKYDSAEDMVKEALKQKKGAGKELLETKKNQKVENIPDYDFSMDDFAHWYEGDGSKQDKAVEKSLRKILGKKNYEALNDYVADNYKKGGHKSAFKKVSSFKEGATKKETSAKKGSKVSVAKSFSIRDYRKEISAMTPAQLKKERAELVSRNGGTINRGNNTGRKIAEIMKLEQMRKVEKKPKKTATDSTDVDKAREVIAKYEKQQAAEKRKAGKQKIAQLKEKGYALVRTGATGSYYAKKGSRIVYNPDGTKAMPSHAEYALAKLAGRKPRSLR